MGLCEVQIEVAWTCRGHGVVVARTLHEPATGRVERGELSLWLAGYTQVFGVDQVTTSACAEWLHASSAYRAQVRNQWRPPHTALQSWSVRRGYAVIRTKPSPPPTRTLRHVLAST